MKRSNVVQYGVIAGCFAALAGLAVAENYGTRAGLSFYSTYDTGPNGYRALYGVLQREGVPVLRMEREIGLLDSSVRTLVLSDNTAEMAVSRAGGIDADDGVRLQHFVRQGGRLVILSDGSESFPRLFARLKLRDPSPAASATLLERIAPVAMTRGVERVAATSNSLYRFSSVRDAVPLLGTREGVAAAAKPIGRGDLIVITTPQVWSNAMLARDDNARFAYDVLADRGPVAFDERIHGYGEDKSFWAALPPAVHVAVWLVIAAVGLWLVDGNVRMAPPVPTDPPDERDSSAYIQSMAALLRRAHAGAASIARFSIDASRRGARHPDRAGVAEVLDELQRLQTISRPGDAALLRAARLHAQLRKELE